MFTFHRMSYLTAFIRPIEPGLHMAPNTDFMGRSDPPYSILPASKEHVKIKRVKLNYGRSRLPVLFWCTIFKNIQAHNTSQRLYLDYIPKRQIMLQTCRDFIYFVWHTGTKFCPYYLCISICCADFYPILFRGGHIHFVGLYLSNSACNKHPNILKYQL